MPLEAEPVIQETPQLPAALMGDFLNTVIPEYKNDALSTLAGDRVSPRIKGENIIPLVERPAYREFVTTAIESTGWDSPIVEGVLYGFVAGTGLPKELTPDATWVVFGGNQGEADTTSRTDVINFTPDYFANTQVTGFKPLEQSKLFFYSVVHAVGKDVYDNKAKILDYPLADGLDRETLLKMDLPPKIIEKLQAGAKANVRLGLQALNELKWLLEGANDTEIAEDIKKYGTDEAMEPYARFIGDPSHQNHGVEWIPRLRRNGILTVLKGLKEGAEANVDSLLVPLFNNGTVTGELAANFDTGPTKNAIQAGSGLTSEEISENSVIGVDVVRSRNLLAYDAFGYAWLTSNGNRIGLITYLPFDVLKMYDADPNANGAPDMITQAEIAQEEGIPIFMFASAAPWEYMDLTLPNPKTTTAPSNQRAFANASALMHRVLGVKGGLSEGFYLASQNPLTRKDRNNRPRYSTDQYVVRVDLPGAPIVTDERKLKKGKLAVVHHIPGKRASYVVVPSPEARDRVALLPPRDIIYRA